jgi:hypothetical protein
VDVAVTDKEEMRIFWSKDHRELAAEQDAHNVPYLRLIGCKAEIAERGLDEFLVVEKVCSKYKTGSSSAPGVIFNRRTWSKSKGTDKPSTSLDRDCRLSIAGLT